MLTLLRFVNLEYSAEISKIKANITGVRNVLKYYVVTLFPNIPEEGNNHHRQKVHAFVNGFLQF